MTMTLRHRIWLAGGLLSPAVLLLTVSVGAVASPVFDWPTDPFSIIGTTGSPVAGLFNVGIAMVGLFAHPFGVHLWLRWHRAVGGLYVLVGVSYIGGGLVPAAAGAVLHEVFGAGVPLGILVLVWTAAVVDWRAGRRHSATAAGVLGGLSLGVWLPYDLGIPWAQIGYGAAELVSFLAYAGWSGWTVIRLWEETNRPGNTSPGAVEDHTEEAPS